MQSYFNKRTDATKIWERYKISLSLTRRTTHVAAKASGDSVPKLAMATAIASSKLFEPAVFRPRE
jgi:hypothetical protein